MSIDHGYQYKTKEASPKLPRATTQGRFVSGNASLARLGRAASPEATGSRRWWRLDASAEFCGETRPLPHAFLLFGARIAGQCPNRRCGVRGGVPCMGDHVGRRGRVSRRPCRRASGGVVDLACRRVGSERCVARLANRAQSTRPRAPCGDGVQRAQIGGCACRKDRQHALGARACPAYGTFLQVFGWLIGHSRRCDVSVQCEVLLKGGRRQPNHCTAGELPRQRRSAPRYRTRRSIRTVARAGARATATRVPRSAMTQCSVAGDQGSTAQLALALPQAMAAAPSPAAVSRRAR